MSLNPGAKLGPYEITSHAGAGGMGEVYKARDTRLNRTVAIKVLPLELTTDTAARQRFEREAHAVAALSHPHICPLFDVGHQDGIDFLVMEFLEGETLAERLSRGKLPLDQAVQFGTQVAGGLAAAHKAGIIHRDLKPANIMVTGAGAKLLDFGLAKPRDPVAIAGMTELPTRQPLTGAGTILGTLQYMAPEQLEGHDADARTDIFAFGAVLYEMLTGRRAFEGGSQATLIGNILHAEPTPLISVEPSTTPALDRATRKCLAKDPDARWQSASDLWDELRWIGQSDARVTGSHAPYLGHRWLPVAAVATAAALLGAVVGGGLIWAWRLPTAGAVLRTSLDVQPAASLGESGPSWTPAGQRTAFAWTPDGRALVFVGSKAEGQQLYVRALDRDGARPLAGTEGSDMPVVSLDGQWVAFWAGGSIRKVPLTGGPVEVLEADAAVAAPPPSRLVWDAAGNILYGGPYHPIRQLGATGASDLTRLAEGELSHSLPSLLPGDQVLLYTVRRRLFTWGDEDVVAYQRATGVTKVLLHDAADARYVSSGHLLFLRRGQLFAVPFDAVRLELRGPPVAVLDGVAQGLTSGGSSNVTGAGQFAVAASGALAWVPNAMAAYPETSLLAVDREGHRLPLSAPIRSYAGPLRVSPDGRRLAVVVDSLSANGLWIYDTVRSTLSTLTSEGEANFPMWTPDGQRLVFGWLTHGRRVLAWQRSDGSAPPDELAPSVWVPGSWSPDGRQFSVVGAGEIRIAKIDPNGKATIGSAILAGSGHRRSAEFSPDGQWLAYEAFESGSSRVYVQPYPGPGVRLQVSGEGGRNPAWNRNGRELFYMMQDEKQGNRMMSAPVRLSPALSVGEPQQLFKFNPGDGFWTCGPTRCYDVSPDGQRFYGVQAPQMTAAPRVTHINLVLNWLDELKERVPSGLAK